MQTANNLMPHLKRTNSSDSDFQNLIKQLDAYLQITDGDEHPFYAQYNKTDTIKNVVVYLNAGIAVACGAFKEFDSETVEIKRMFVQPDFRGMGIGLAVLNELEKWATELGFKYTILETGKKQTEAIRLYQKAGYDVIPNFGQYENVENSVCMRREINEIDEKIK